MKSSASIVRVKQRRELEAQRLVAAARLREKRAALVARQFQRLMEQRR